MNFLSRRNMIIMVKMKVMVMVKMEVMVMVKMKGMVMLDMKVVEVTGSPKIGPYHDYGALIH